MRLVSALVILLLIPMALAVLSHGERNVQSNLELPKVVVIHPDLENEERLLRVVHLQKIWRCVREDCWQQQTFASNLCRIAQKFSDIRELYESLNVPDADPDSGNLAVRPEDPRLNVDMQLLEKVREENGRAYVRWLWEDFREYVDVRQDPVDICDPSHPGKSRLDGILNRMMEVSEDSGLKDQYPTREEIDHLADFAISEQVELFRKGQKSRQEASFFIESFFRIPDKYLVR